MSRKKLFLERSKILKANPILAGRIIDIGEAVYSHGDEHDSLEKKIWERYEHEYGNPVAVAILLKIIIPIVVNLLIEWWNKE